MVLASTPGPGVFATISCALASGFVAAIAVVIGTVLGDLIFLLLAIFGLALVIQSIVISAIITLIVGGVMLFYAYLASKARFFFQSETAMRNLNRTAAGILLGVAVLIVFVE